MESQDNVEDMVMLECLDCRVSKANGDKMEPRDGRAHQDNRVQKANKVNMELVGFRDPVEIQAPTQPVVCQAISASQVSLDQSANEAHLGVPEMLGRKENKALATQEFEDRKVKVVSTDCPVCLGYQELKAHLEIMDSQAKRENSVTKESQDNVDMLVYPGFLA